MSDAELNACSELSWSPPLPTIGRGGQRATVPMGTFEQKLKSYFLQVESSPDFFVRTVDATFRRRHSLYGKNFPERVYLRDLDWTLQYKYITSRLYVKLSLHFQRKLSLLLCENKLHRVRQWFYTANGVVYPYLIAGGDEYVVIDHLTRYALEGCATNYAHFMSSLKKTKKLIRKFCAINNPVNGITIPVSGAVRQHMYYVSAFNDIHSNIVSKAERFRMLLLWTQSRATGLCDASMIDKSLSKFRKTVSEPCLPLNINVEVLQSCIRSGNVTGASAQVSVGPKSCLQCPQAPVIAEDSCYLPGSRKDPVGGQTRYLLYLATHKVLLYEYDLLTLEKVPCKPRPVRSSHDLLSWAIHECLTNGPRVRSVRFHCVEDQSKARSITVAHLAYQVIMGVMAHALVPALYSAETKTGLSKDRNLWRFLHEQLSPESPSWDGFLGHSTQVFCTDLEEATDFGNWWFARAVWSEFIRQTAGRHQPLGLMVLAKTLYTSPRSVFFKANGNNYDYFNTHRAFLMGDLFTKVVLTIGQDYNVRLALMNSPLGDYGSNNKIQRIGTLRPYNIATLRSVPGALTRTPVRPVLSGAAYSLVGDDVVILYAVIKHQMVLEPYFREAAESGGWKLSEDDTFDSKHLMFYCEEGSLVPSGPHKSTRHSIWRGKEIEYLDYPRIRLLLPVKVETNTYSHTNVGRFALMGKESLWVTGTSSRKALDMYSIATIMQHLTVPRDIETLCPFTPQEIGGDGAYTPDVEFFSQVISAKSKDPAETLYRMQRQLSKTWANKFVSSDKPRGGVMKQHLILPTLDRLKKWIPERSIIVPESPEHAELYSALPRGILESPQLTFFKLVKRVYNSHLFRGILLPNLMVSSDVSSKRGATPLAELERFFLSVDDQGSSNFSRYLENWRRPGFQYRNTDPYFVVPDRHRDIMSLGWNWKFRPERPTEVARIDVHSFLDVIRHGRDVPLIVDRLNMFFESDPLIMIRVRENPHIRGRIGLVSRDKRLAHRVSRWVRSNRDRMANVFLISPEFYILGRMGEFPYDVILPDAGSINFLERNGSLANFSETECEPPVFTRERNFPGVTSVTLRGFNYPRPKGFTPLSKLILDYEDESSLPKKSLVEHDFLPEYV
uniref:RNA-dependent RNA polymerase n=1 Tax=Plasmopara viticola lesion associated narnavirus 30 TaxID=2719515 RepID=A0A6G9RTI1_9VIRU|nr:RNA-dependent RNA polymerase [Plasmopara viticola lesion associated narnavirus 30]